jgi:hypothetical protein
VVIDTGLSTADKDFVSALAEVLDPADVQWLWITPWDRDDAARSYEHRRGAYVNFLNEVRFQAFRPPCLCLRQATAEKAVADDPDDGVEVLAVARAGSGLGSGYPCWPRCP